MLLMLRAIARECLTSGHARRSVGMQFRAFKRRTFPSERSSAPAPASAGLVIHTAPRPRPRRLLCGASRGRACAGMPRAAHLVEKWRLPSSAGCKWRRLSVPRDAPRGPAASSCLEAACLSTTPDAHPRQLRSPGRRSGWRLLNGDLRTRACIFQPTDREPPYHTRPTNETSPLWANRLLHHCITALLHCCIAALLHC